jgi:hypothetical protein
MKRFLVLVAVAGLSISMRAHAAGVSPVLDPKVEAALEAEFSGAELATARLYRAASEQERSDWRKAIREARADDEGCATAAFPSTTWTKVDCVDAPDLPHTVGGPNPTNGNYHLAESTGAALNQVTGYFADLAASGLTTTNEEDTLFGQDHFSVQLNTDYFQSSACASAADPSACTGWEQFIYSVPGSSSQGSVFIEFWIVNYGKNCPSGQSWHQVGSGANISCWKNSTAVSTPSHSPTILDNENTHVLGYISGPTHEGVTVILAGTAYSHVAGSNLYPSGQWHYAEFNVWGYANSSEALFGPGVQLSPTMYSDDPYTSTLCVQDFGGGGNYYSYTGESNNFNANFGCYNYLPTGGPGISFDENNYGICSYCY